MQFEIEILKLKLPISEAYRIESQIRTAELAKSFWYKFE